MIVFNWGVEDFKLKLFEVVLSERCGLPDGIVSLDYSFLKEVASLVTGILDRLLGIFIILMGLRFKVFNPEYFILLVQLARTTLEVVVTDVLFSIVTGHLFIFSEQWVLFVVSSELFKFMTLG